MNRRRRIARITRIERAIAGGAAFVGAVVLTAGMLVLAGAGAASADTANDGGGIGISVDIPSVTPTPTDPGSPGDGGGPGHGGPGDGGSNGGGHSGGGKGGSGDGGVDNGPLNISGLHAEFIPSLNPLAGKVVVWFSVHNGSKTTISSTARFWLTGPVGNTLSDSGRVTVPPIKPKTTVRIQQTLDNVGQWTVLTAHATYFPPGSVDGITLKSVARDVTIFAFPWLGAAGVTLGCTGFGIAFFLRSSLGALAAVSVA